MKYYFIYRNKDDNEIKISVKELDKTQDEITEKMKEYNSNEKITATVKQIFDKETQEVMEAKSIEKDRVFDEIKSCIRSINIGYDELSNSIDCLKDYLSEVDDRRKIIIQKKEI